MDDERGREVGAHNSTIGREQLDHLRKSSLMACNNKQRLHLIRSNEGNTYSFRRDDLRESKYDSLMNTYNYKLPVFGAGL